MGSSRPNPVAGQVWERVDRRWLKDPARFRVSRVGDTHVELEAINLQYKQELYTAVSRLRFKDKYKYLGEKDG